VIGNRNACDIGRFPFQGPHPSAQGPSLHVSFKQPLVGPPRFSAFELDLFPCSSRRREFRKRQFEVGSPREW
jgi:hypothetical protein